MGEADRKVKRAMEIKDTKRRETKERRKRKEGWARVGRRG